MAINIGVPEGSRARTTIEDVPHVVTELQTALKAKFSGYAHVSAIIGADPKWSLHVSYDQGTVRQHATKIFRGEDGSFDAAADAMRAWLAVDEVALGHLTLGLTADGRLPADTLDDVAGRR